MRQAHNTLTQNIPSRSVELLNKHPAAMDLRAKVKQPHWNAPGAGFIATHEPIDRVSEEVEGVSDLIAERAGVIGAERSRRNRGERRRNERRDR